MIFSDEFKDLIKQPVQLNSSRSNYSKYESLTTFRESPKKAVLNYPKEQQTLFSNASYLLKQSNRIGIKKRLRIFLIVLRFIRRLQRVINESPYQHSLANLKKVKKTTLKLPQTINEKFKAWCLGIFQKSFSTIPQNLFNYIKSPGNKIKEDNSQFILINAIKFFFENMAYFTHPDIVSIEIKHFLFSQLFLNEKNQFTAFVSVRTPYISHLNNEITLDQQSMIIMEVLLFFRFAFILFEFTNTSQFAIIMLISTLQHLYLKKYTCLKSQYQPQQNLIQLTIEETKNQKYILKADPQQTLFSSNQIIYGTYPSDEIEKLLNLRPNFDEKITQYFNKTIEHLQLFLIDFYQ
ncbi:unnamed protein product (macronuclear) [Paramecium tetraurelia]|uniref:Uncharacterized protein n=1 Tax=Paramecium tetraurelia TaxID=5888 RepID=A0CVF0_PARTE|nr:uncharacterized protein GSPATT00010935001 [Paramecium tetraurelia]CAK74767.1 unnamed protein product [Paramecium tetraurelia]|eukprot:XP_001442164.1 hypothetical protein (macronuclear) [Paramecium tetraurelia strain d4-2]